MKRTSNPEEVLREFETNREPIVECEWGQGRWVRVNWMARGAEGFFGQISWHGWPQARHVSFRGDETFKLYGKEED